MKTHFASLALVSLMVLPACQTAVDPTDPPAILDPETGKCFSSATTPAILETVTEQIIDRPAVLNADGSVASPASFRTITRQRIVTPRADVEFETPCPDALTAEFIASVQRALRARGYYQGAITGQQDAQTRQAIQRFQRDQGDVHTSALTMRTAQALGLVAFDRNALQ